MSSFTLQYFTNFNYNDLLTRLFRIFLPKKLIISKFSESCLKSSSEEKGWMERKGSGLLVYDAVFRRLRSYWAAFISSQLLTAEGLCFTSHTSTCEGPSISPQLRVWFPHQISFQAKQYFLKAVSTRLESRIFGSLLASIVSNNIFCLGCKAQLTYLHLAASARTGQTKQS